jgi:AcrR family transcriptional regulator
MRPKKISDSRLLELATDIIIEYGPEVFTLRQVAKYVKVSPATLIKRFETKENLLIKCISQHIDKISISTIKEDITFERFLMARAREHNNDNFIQNISILARDMKEPALNKIANKYFTNFRENLSQIINRDSRFGLIQNQDDCVLQIDAIFQGAIIQGAFIKKTSIRRNIQLRISDYLYRAYKIELNW